MDELKITQRHLPHWELSGSTYFVTFRLKDGVMNKEEQIIVLEHIKDGNGKFYTLIAVVVMPDHVHLLFIPKEGYTLSRIMKGIKGVSSHKINLKRKISGTIWQDESFDRIMRNEDELKEKINYMLYNPLKKGLTDNPENYYGWYYNEKFEW
jgi:REP element-mobilizing transposase RayT